MLEFDGLTRRYGPVVALDDLSFTVPAGQVFGFLGPNGAGKTTAMRAAFGLVALDAGEVRWKGSPITTTDRRRCGYMPEDAGCIRGWWSSIRSSTWRACTGCRRRRPAPPRNTGSSAWGSPTGRAPRWRRSRSATSSTPKLAAALVHEPELLVLDEPLSGLDPVGIDAVSAVLAEQAHAGRGVLFSSHQLDLVEDLCESVAIIDHGRLVATGSVEELATAGKRRLVVKVEGDWSGSWARPGTRGERVARGRRCGPPRPRRGHRPSVGAGGRHARRSRRAVRFRASPAV